MSQPGMPEYRIPESNLGQAPAETTALRKAIDALDAAKRMGMGPEVIAQLTEQVRLAKGQSAAGEGTPTTGEMVRQDRRQFGTGLSPLGVNPGV